MNDGDSLRNCLRAGFEPGCEALGCVGLRCEREEDVVDVINQAREINDRPVVIDFIVGADAQVWPMVAAGTSNDEIQAARGIRPLFDDETEGHA